MIKGYYHFRNSSGDDVEIKNQPKGNNPSHVQTTTIVSKRACPFTGKS